MAYDGEHDAMTNDAMTNDANKQTGVLRRLTLA